MSPEQVRAARGWLGWSQKDLADKSHVSLSTIKDFESGARKPIANNLGAIKQALEAEGFHFACDETGHPTGISKRGVSARH